MRFHRVVPSVVGTVRITQGEIQGLPGHWRFVTRFDDLCGYAYHWWMDALCDRVNLRMCENERCGRHFEPNHANRLFCGTKCSEAAKKRAHRARAASVADLSLT